MTSAADVVAGLLPALEGKSRYDRDRAIKWAFPQLSMRVYASSAGVNVYAIVEQLNERGIPTYHEIANHTWVPGEVTEALLVEWGARALAVWLETQVPAS